MTEFKSTLQIKKKTVYFTRIISHRASSGYDVDLVCVLCKGFI